MDKANEEQQGKKCFVITPIGSENSDIFRKAKGVIESVIKPILKEYGFDDVKPAYEINVSGIINTQVVNRIIDDDLVIANLTGNNPNVMYELCLRHVTTKPIIHICENGTELPFDIKGSRTIFYTNDMLGVEELKAKLNDFLQEIDYQSEYIDNPIYGARKMDILLKNIPVEGGNSVEILLKKIYEKLDNNTFFNYTNSRHTINNELDAAKCDYAIRVTGIGKAASADAFGYICSELKKRNIHFVKMEEDTMYFANRGNTTCKRINEIMPKIEADYNVKIETFQMF